MTTTTSNPTTPVMASAAVQARVAVGLADRHLVPEARREAWLTTRAYWTRTAYDRYPPVLVVAVVAGGAMWSGAGYLAWLATVTLWNYYVAPHLSWLPWL